MLKNLAALVACLLLSLPGCSKATPGLSGSSGFRIKEPVHVSYGWSKGRMAYVIFFVPNTGTAFSSEGLAANVKIGKDKEGDTFDGALDGYLEKSKAPFKADAKNGTFSFEGKNYRTVNGIVFLINVGTPSKLQQIQLSNTIPGAPKDELDIPSFMETQVRKLLKENPKISEFPNEPPKPDKTKKK